MDNRSTWLEEALRKVIPERIREAREAQGLTAEIFGEKIGVTRQAIAQYETGQTSPSAAVLGEIIPLLASLPVFLLNRAGEMRVSSSLRFGAVSKEWSRRNARVFHGAWSGLRI